MNDWKDWEKMEMAPVWDFEERPVLKGVLTNIEHGVGPNESIMYTFELDTHERVGVWGNTLLDSRLKNAIVGQEIGIHYLGKATSEKTKRTYKNFEVYKRPMEKTDDMPFPEKE